MGKKGFFFVIVAFVLLSYILASTYIWVRAIEMEESRYSESFRTSSMEMLVDQLNEKSVSQMANIMSNYAFYKLDNHSIRNPVEPGGDEGTPEEFNNVRLAMRGLILNGSASDDYFEGVGTGLEYTAEEKEDYTLYGWGAKLNKSLSASGFELEQFEIDESSFVLNQTDYLLYQVNFTMSLRIKEMKSGSSTSLVRNYTVSTLVNATGMVDPYIARESIDLYLPGGKIAERQAFMAPYDFETYMGRDDLGYEEDYPSGYPEDPITEDSAPDEIFQSLCSSEGSSCYYVENGNAGQGWFYGPMVSADDSDEINTILEAEKAGQFILVGNYSEIIDVDDHELFGAYILTNEPGEEPSVCGSNMDEYDTFNPITWIEETSGCEATIDGERTFRPFAVNEGFDLGDYIGDKNQHKVLFISQYSTNEVAGDAGDPALKNTPVAFYDVEMFRDFVACGYYLPRSESPSFLQRMFDIGDNAESMRADTLFGIETTVAGQWAGGNYTPEYDQYSRVEVEFFGEPQKDGSRIMGMPGCKNVVFCTEDSNSDVGQFRISPDAFERYNIEDGDGISNDNIACAEDPSGNAEHAGCDYED